MAANRLPLWIWVDGSDEPLEVTADQRDTSALELEYRESFPTLLDKMPEVVFRFVGWHAARRAGLIKPGEDGQLPGRQKWLENVVEVEPSGKGEPANPGSPAATDES